MAISNQQILDFLTANPGMTDAQIVTAMETYGVSPAQMAQAVGLDEGAVAARVAATIPQGQTVTLGDTIVQPQYQVIGSGEDQQIGNLENVYTYKVGENQVGGGYQQYTPTGELERTGTQQEVKSGLKEFALGSALLFGGLGGGFESLFGGGGAATGGTVGSTGLTMGELAQLDLALGGAGGTAGATSLANALMTGAAIPTITSLTGGSGTGVAGTIGNTGLTLSELTQLDMSLGGTGGTLGALTLAEQLGGLTAGTLTGGLLTGGGSPLAPTTTPLTPNPPTVPPTIPPTVPPTVPPVVPPVVPPTLPPIPPVVPPVIPPIINSLLTPKNIGNLLTSGATTAAGLLQQQTSREAAQKAQAMIDRETAAAKQAAQFRPIGMTTRFGTSQFQVDPVTGQLISAGYTLDPQAKNAQDRFVALAEQGLQQAEGAQAQFAPLQTGAQNLFNLGNQYIAQNPQDVAQNYLNQQMALLQPGRELELATLQNRLQQQGRGGLSVAQGGTMGATTPELQALYNARATQEAQLAAIAQQYGQQNVAFGAGLLGTGAQTMGNYYGGQQAAYQPYTTALGQVTGLEALGQQPFTLGAQLGQTASTAGARVGQLGLQGAGQSVALATGPAATTNPYATLLSGLGASPAFGQAIGGLFS